MANIRVEDIYLHLRQRWHRPESDATFQALALRAIAETQRDVWYRFEGKKSVKTATVTTVEDQQAYSLESDFWSIDPNSIYDVTNDRSIRLITQEEWYRMWEASTTDGEPQVAFIDEENDEIEFEPYPDTDDMTIRYKYFSTVTDPNDLYDELSLGKDWEEAVRTGSDWRIGEWLNEPDTDTVRMRQLYENAVSRAIGADIEKSEPQMLMPRQQVRWTL